MIEVSHVNIRKSISLLVGRLAVLYLIITGVSITVFIPGEFIRSYLQLEIRGYEIATSIILNGGQLLLAIYVILDWLCEYYEIHPDRIIYKKGIFFQHEQQYYLRNIAAIECTEGSWGQMFNMGSIHLYDFMTQKHFWMNMIHNPKRCFEILKQLLPERDTTVDYMAPPVISDKDKQL